MGDWQGLLQILRETLFSWGLCLGAIGLLIWKVKARPSGWTLTLTLVPVLLWGLCFFWPSWSGLLHWYMPILAILLLIDGLLLSIPVSQISLTRALNRKFSIGQNNAVQLTVTNHSALPLVARVQDSVPALLPLKNTEVFGRTWDVRLAPFAHLDVSYDLFPLRRGIYEFERIHCQYRSRLGLLWLVKRDGRPETITVLPDLRRIRRMRIQNTRAQASGELLKRSLGAEGVRFSGLRYFFPGDDVRKIAWQTTARLDVPVVRTFEPEVEQPIMVLLDAGRTMEGCIRGLQKFDWAVNAALAFMGVAIDRHDCVGVGVFSTQLHVNMPIASGRSHLNKILQTLSEAEVDSQESDYETVLLQTARFLRQRTLLILFTDLIDPDASKRLVRSLLNFPQQHLLMVVTFMDSDAFAVGRGIPQNAYEAYCKGVSQDLLALRRKTMAHLNRGGRRRAIVIDSAPEKLDEQLIQRYLEIKSHGRL